MIDITALLTAVITVIGSIITTFLIPFLKSKLSEEKRRELVDWIQIAVSAAEQIYTGSGRGKEKKEYVMNFLQNYGYSIDSAEVQMTVDALIEASVKQLTLSGK